jgi:hypothetical protein
MRPIFPLPLAAAALLAVLVPAGTSVGEAQAGPHPAPPSAPPPADRLAPPPARGMALGLFSQDPRHDSRPQLREIADLGATSVAIVVTYFQRDVFSHEIYPDPTRTPAVETIRETLREAERLGLATMLFPYVRVDQVLEPDDWRGTLEPRDRGAWFAAYEAWIMEMARIAAAEGVEILSIGSEMSTMDVDTERWIGIITRLRPVFSGQITYSSNWDHYQRIGFWDHVDLIGLTGYFELVPPDESDPTLEEVIEGWREWHVRLMRWQSHQGRPLLMTEVGYRSNDGASAFPWKWGEADNRVDLDEQRILYEAYTRMWSNEPRLGGVFFWNWWGEGGPNDHDYTPRGKPAEAVLRRWLSGQMPAIGLRP